jgi:HD-like signal output (HDOD) protein
VNTLQVTPAPTTSDNEAAPPELSVRMRAEIRNIGIPPRPALLDEIDREMRRDAPDFKRLAEIISADVGLSAGLVKVANSPYYGFGKQVRSVQETLLVLGLRVVIRTVAGLALQQVFPNVPSLERFWDSAARTARVSGWLAGRLKGQILPRPEDAYTLGLFRDCGIALLMIPFPEYPEILRQANAETTLSFTDVEDRLLSINHAIVGAELAEDWLLPEDIHLAIRHHHDRPALADAERLPDMPRQLIALCQIAEFLIQQTTGMSRTQEWNKLGDDCLRMLDIAPEQLDTLLADCREVVAAEI